MIKLDPRPARPLAAAHSPLWVLRLALLAGILAVALTAVLAPAFASAACSTCAPWWHLTSGTRPTYLHAGLARSEVQKLTVTQAEGSFEVERRAIRNSQSHSYGHATLPVSATAAEFQSALEDPTIYGSGNVEVTGPTVEGPETRSWTVTFKGELKDQDIRPITVRATTSSVNELTAGRPDGEIFINATNIGDGPAIGIEETLLHVGDVLPANLEAVGVSAQSQEEESLNGQRNLTCVLASVSCTFEGRIPPFLQIEMRIAVVVKPGASSGEQDTASVSGGGAPSAQVSSPITISDQPVPYGVERHELMPEEAGGAPATQAGKHPFQLTDTLILNSAADLAALDEPAEAEPPLAKDVQFHWPPGLIGNPQAIERCSVAKFDQVVGENGSEDACPASAAVGVASVTVDDPGLLGTITFVMPLFNLEPAVGEPARFGFFVPMANIPVLIDPAIRAGGDYGITVKTLNISEVAYLLKSVVSVWGVPGDPSHDRMRGWGCLYESRGVPIHSPCEGGGAQHPPPFLSLPTSCTGPMPTTVQTDSWAEPLPANPPFSRYVMPALGGCNELPFTPQVKTAVDGHAASTPTGLNVDVHVPQESILNGAGLAASAVKDITVDFPEGLVVNPASADGLQACSEAQIGFTGSQELNPEYQPGVSTMTFTGSEPSCPDAAKIGTVTVKSPLLPPGEFVEGALYLATPAPNGEVGKNPFNALIATYIVARDPKSGVLLKLPGSVSLDPVTGRISSTFQNNPQLAFEDAEIHLFGGSRAPFATPSHCGSYTTEASFTPWSGNKPVLSSSSFDVTSGPGGSPCPGVLPFTPLLAAGTSNINSGAFTDLTTTISREDGNRDIQTVTLHMPAGLEGILKGVGLCDEAHANAGTCGPESLIGHTVVSVGLGGDPFSVTGGQVFLTERYKGGAFGLSIVNPAVAGPFDLGKVVVRASIAVDPRTAELTITTDNIPHILRGIPLQIKHVNVTIDRPGFTFNPTNCNKLQVTGNIGSVEGATAPVSTQFQVTNCASLKFTPTVAVSTKARPTKKNGSSLIFKIAYPKGAMGTQSWFNEAKFDLPKQLPARLTTIQKACLASVFDANPAACPPASLIGHAVVHTPVLPVPLAGPVYFVSHGGAKFPDAVIVLQGYGVTVRLTGETFINGKTGITSATFRNTPDVPFENIEVSVPSGPFSEFGANLPAKAKGSFCGQKLVMPTLFKAQNGLEVHKNTAVSVIGCPKHKKKKHHARKHAKKRGHRRRK